MRYYKMILMSNLYLVWPMATSALYGEEDLDFLLQHCSCHPINHPSCVVLESLLEHHMIPKLVCIIGTYLRIDLVIVASCSFACLYRGLHFCLCFHLHLISIPPITGPITGTIILVSSSSLDTKLGTLLRTADQATQSLYRD